MSTAAVSRASVWRQALVLAAITLVLGVGSWLVRPDRLPLRADAEFYTLDLPAPLVAVATALPLHEDGSHVFVDTRPDADLDSAVAGAFIVRAAHFDDDLAEAADFLYPEDPVIVYGEDSPVPVGDVAALLLARGFEDVRILQGGLEAWRAAGGPLEGGAP